MKQLPLSALITTSAIVASDAFISLPRTPLHLHSTNLQAIAGPIPASAPLIPGFTSTSNPTELKSFLSSHRKSHLSPQLSDKNSRYGGRASPGEIISRSSGQELDRDADIRAILGFDLGLNMVSRSVESMDSDWAAELDRERMMAGGAESAIVDVNQSSKSPITKQIASNLQSQYSPIDFFEKRRRERENDDGRVGSKSKKNTMDDEPKTSSVPGWFPYTPTRRQVESLKVIELRDACLERGLQKGGNKMELQNKLIEWTNSQHRRRVLERNAMRTQAAGESLIHNAINDALFNSVPVKTSKDTKGYTNKESSRGGDVDFNCVEPLINRRKALLRSKRFSFSKSKGTLGFGTDVGTDIDDEDETIGSDDLKPTKDYLTDLRKTFDKNVEKAPNNYQVKQLYQEAKHADQAGDFKSAKVYLQKLREVTPRDTRVIRRLARLEMQEGKVHIAREILQSGLRSMSNNGDILQGLGKLELACGNVNSARRHFKDAMAASPTFPNPYHALATLEHSLGNIRVSTTILRSGLKHCPSNHRLHHALGDLYREAKMLDMAEKTYHKGLKCIDAETEETGRNFEWSKTFLYTALSYVAYERDEIDESREWLRKSTSGNNRMHSQGWLGLAQLEESERELENTREVYSEALQNYEHSRRISKFRSSSRVGHKRFIKPAKPGDKWINVYNSWAKLEKQYGDYDSANNVYSRAATAFPNEWKVFLNWAQFQVSNGRLDRARALFELACDSAGSRNADPYRCYAEFEMSSGNYKRARSILFLGAQSLSESSDGTRHNDEFARLYHCWAVCEWHLGNLDRAEILFDNSLRLIESGSKGSANRSLVLYSIARFLFYARNDSIVAQHCICLSISENLSPSGDAGIWLLWAKIAESMSNTKLKKSCLAQAEKLDFMANNKTSLVLADLGIDQMLRKSPWQYKIQKPSSREKDSWYRGISFPRLDASPLLQEP